jgi:hypothetical protein
MGHVCDDRTGTCTVSNRSWRYHSAVGAGFLLSSFFLWITLRKIDGQHLGEAFASISYFPIFLCAGALSLGIVLRSVRWRVVAGASSSEKNNFLRATKLGVLANLLFPGRAGEIVRVISLAKLSQSTLPGPLASSLIDRLVDIFVLLVSASILFWFFPNNAELWKWLPPFLLVGSTSTLLVFLYARSSGISEALIPMLAKRLLQRWSQQPVFFMADLRSEFRFLLSRWLNIKVVVLAALILCTDYAAIAVLLQAFNLTLGFEAPLLLWVFLAAGSALPSAHGYVGVYQVAAIWALSIFGVSASIAVALSAVLQITTLAVALIMAGPEALIVFKKMLLNKKTVRQSLPDH